MDFETFLKQYHMRLNEQQLKAVQAVEGPVLLLAVPGSGKTTVLVTRLGYMLLCCGIPADNILTITYTVSATQDMKRRFAGIFGEQAADGLEFRTINGICSRIINYYGRAIGKKPFSLISDERRIGQILSGIYHEQTGEYLTENELRSLKTSITFIKNSMLTKEEIQKLDEEAEEDAVKVAPVYEAYQREMRQQSAMDYDDQMCYALQILKKSPRVLEYFRQQYQYILVDEAQDTSKVQHAIISLLAGERGNLFMVGDEDQSIYGFRAAYPKALLSFEEDHPDAKVLKLETNYRSLAGIVNAADRFIRRNKERHEKHMVAANDVSSGVRVTELKSRYAQYSWLCSMAENCTEKTAVLYRDNETMLPLLDLMDRRGIPYRLRSTEAVFFTHRIVQDVRNMILFALHPEDTELFMQIYYKLGMYLDKASAIQACHLGRKHGIPVLEAALRYLKLPKQTASRCRDVMQEFQYLPQDTAKDAIGRISSGLGYSAYLKSAGLDDNKLYILRSLSYQEETPQSFLDRLDYLQQLVSQGSSGMRETAGAAGAKAPVILSTIHSAKGLEYERVFLLDIVDGVFPTEVPEITKHTAPEVRQAFEEERRIFYVAVTRAKRELTLFRINGKPSVFLKEFLAKEKQPAGKDMDRKKKRNAASYSGQSAFSGGNPYKKRKMPSIRSAASDPELKAFVDTLAVGMIVKHKRFGEGVITALDDTTIEILFGKGLKNFSLAMLYTQGLLST